MAAYRRVYDSHHLQADCQEPESAPEPYARQSSMGYVYLSLIYRTEPTTSVSKVAESIIRRHRCVWSPLATANELVNCGRSADERCAVHSSAGTLQVTTGPFMSTSPSKLPLNSPEGPGGPAVPD